MKRFIIVIIIFNGPFYHPTQFVFKEEVGSTLTVEQFLSLIVSNSRLDVPTVHFVSPTIRVSVKSKVPRDSSASSLWFQTLLWHFFFLNVIFKDAVSEVLRKHLELFTHDTTNQCPVQSKEAGLQPGFLQYQKMKLRLSLMAGRHKIKSRWSKKKENNFFLWKLQNFNK